MNTRPQIVAILTVLSTVALTGGLVLAAPRQPVLRDDTPPIPPASDFRAQVDNPWYPLKPGSRYVYAGVKDGLPAGDILTVTHQHATIDGVPCVVVHDRLYRRGRLFERTTDWYTQDTHGNVWYFGENTAELDTRGHVTSTAGTWTAGVAGAKPGIFMPAHPRVGQSGQQEFYAGQAADHFKVIGLFATIAGPTTKNTLLTKEWTPLEPGTLDHKLYVRGIGTVLEQTEKGPSERAELISLTQGH